MSNDAYDIKNMTSVNIDDIGWSVIMLLKTLIIRNDPSFAKQNILKENHGKARKLHKMPFI